MLVFDGGFDELHMKLISRYGVCISLENIPGGIKAKETYRILSDDEIRETFEIEETGKDFAIYSRVKLVRKK